MQVHVLVPVGLIVLYTTKQQTQRLLGLLLLDVCIKLVSTKCNNKGLLGQQTHQLTLGRIRILTGFNVKCANFLYGYNYESLLE